MPEAKEVQAVAADQEARGLVNSSLPRVRLSSMMAPGELVDMEGMAAMEVLAQAALGGTVMALSVMGL